MNRTTIESAIRILRHIKTRNPKVRHQIAVLLWADRAALRRAA